MSFVLGILVTKILGILVSLILGILVIDTFVPTPSFKFDALAQFVGRIVSIEQPLLLSACDARVRATTTSASTTTASSSLFALSWDTLIAWSWESWKMNFFQYNMDGQRHNTGLITR